MSEYKVGYGRPPVEHRIRPGERRNPHGRPRKVKPVSDNSAAAILRRLDEELVEVNGRKMTKREAEIRVLQMKALKGDTKASMLLDRMRSAAGLDKPQVGGGVLLIPSPVPLHEWEASAAIQQARHRERDPDAAAS